MLLLLEVQHVNAVRFNQLTLQDARLRLRISVECGPGYDDHSQGLSGSHVFFGLLLPASTLRLDVQYGADHDSAKYQQLLHDCGTVPSSRPPSY